MSEPQHPQVPDDRVPTDRWSPDNGPAWTPPAPPPSYGYPGPVAPGPHPPYGGQTLPPPPDNNLVWGILATLLCCLPLGIVSIVKAASVNSLWFQGQYEAAHRAAASARQWAIWSAAVGVGGALLYVVLMLGIFTQVGY